MENICPLMPRAWEQPPAVCCFPVIPYYLVVWLILGLNPAQLEYMLKLSHPSTPLFKITQWLCILCCHMLWGESRRLNQMIENFDNKAMFNVEAIFFKTFTINSILKTACGERCFIMLWCHWSPVLLAFKENYLGSK